MQKRIFRTGTINTTKRLEIDVVIYVRPRLLQPRSLHPRNAVDLCDCFNDSHSVCASAPVTAYDHTTFMWLLQTRTPCTNRIISNRSMEHPATDLVRSDLHIRSGTPVPVSCSRGENLARPGRLLAVVACAVWVVHRM